jgi:group I intron endonuclease
MSYLSEEFYRATVKVFFYIIINIIDGKIYVGQTVDFDRRKPTHISNSRSKLKRHKKIKLYEAMRKYGIENFEFVLLPIVKYSKKLANAEEKRLIKEYNTFGEGSWGYNMNEGGEGGSYRHTQESKDKIRASSTGVPKTKEHIENARLGRIKNRNPLDIRDGEKSPSSKKWKLTFEDGTTLIVHGLQKWCKENGYSFQNLSHMYHGKRKRHKNIIKVERLD